MTTDVYYLTDRNNAACFLRAPEKPSGTEDMLARSEARKKLPDKNLDFQVCYFICYIWWIIRWNI